MNDLTGNAFDRFSSHRVVQQNRRQSLSVGDLKINTLPRKAFDLNDSEAFHLRVSERE